MNRNQEMRKETACFTGHREIPEPPEAVAERLDAAIRSLYALGVRFYGAGGARGFDALAARRVLTLKRELPALRLILVLPFPEQYRQEGNWSRGELAEFDAILMEADKVVTLESAYSGGVYGRRNRYMVDHSAWCVNYLLRPRSGTGSTVDYARKQGLTLVDLAPRQEEPEQLYF